MRLIQGDCLEEMAGLEAGSVDMVVTSPPYDNLRTYNGSIGDWCEDKWKRIIKELHRVVRPGGVVVWVVGDATVKGSETGTSFKQALWAMECGFRLHDTMIWNKGCFSAVGALAVRYAPVFEYMFVWSKGKPRVFNPIKDKPNKWAGGTIGGTLRLANGSMRRISNEGRRIEDFGQRYNIWDVAPQRGRGNDCHPAPFPVSIAQDHILSWSNPGDVVLDPFMGSGTTGVACVRTGREFVGIERDPTYFAVAEGRIQGEIKGGVEWTQSK